MRIACCHCGPRGHEEFTYHGDATVLRPAEPGRADLALPPTTPADRLAWHDYVYLRDNPAGAHRELWQHTAGCRAWLVVRRNTVTHAILAVEPARDIACARSGRPA